VVRPYWLVNDINKALDQVVQQGAVVAMPRMEIPGKGFFAIYILGGTDQGFWEL
jgi:predicted enzyme related to lactoylglutathione lyase